MSRPSITFTIWEKWLGCSTLACNAEQIKFKYLEAGGNQVTAKASDFVVACDKLGALGPKLTLYNKGGSAGAGGAIDFNGYDVGATAPTARILSVDDGHYSSHISFATKKPGSADNELVESVRITSEGNIDIGGKLRFEKRGSRTRGFSRRSTRLSIEADSIRWETGEYGPKIDQGAPPWRPDNSVDVIAELQSLRSRVKKLEEDLEALRTKT